MWILHLCVQCTWSSVLAVDDVVYSGFSSACAVWGVLEKRFGDPGKFWKNPGTFSKQESGNPECSPQKHVEIVSQQNSPGKLEWWKCFWIRYSRIICFDLIYSSDITGDHCSLYAGPRTGSGGFQWQRRKNSRLEALCEASKQLQLRLQNETQRFHSDFTDQGFNSFLKRSMFSCFGCWVKIPLCSLFAVKWMSYCCLLSLFLLLCDSHAGKVGIVLAASVCMWLCLSLSVQKLKSCWLKKYVLLWALWVIRFHWRVTLTFNLERK